MGSRKVFLLIQNSIAVGDRLLSYLATVCTTNVCAVNPDSFFTETVRLFSKHGCVPCIGHLLLLGTTIQNARVDCWDSKHGLQGAKKQRRDKSWPPLLCNISEHRFEQNLVLPGVLVCHLSLTTRLAACACWLPSASSVTFRNRELSPRNFLTYSASAGSLLFCTAPLPCQRKRHQWHSALKAWGFSAKTQIRKGDAGMNRNRNVVRNHTEVVAPSEHFVVTKGCLKRNFKRFLKIFCYKNISLSE